MLKKRKREGFSTGPAVIPASSKEDAQEMEMLLITMIGRSNVGTGPLFNKTDGGSGATGCIHPPETEENRQKKRESGLRASSRPEVIAARSEGIKKALARPQSKINQQNAALRIGADPIAQEKKVASMKKTLATPEGKARKSLAAKKPCTDGITEYNSISDMVAALGKQAKKLTGFKWLPRKRNENR